MGSKTVWRASSNGPDWTDIALTMASLEEFHAAGVTLEITRDGVREDGNVKITARAVLRSAYTTAASRSVSRSVWYPNANSRTLEGAVYKLLLELDLDCGAMWAQSTLFLT